LRSYKDYDFDFFKIARELIRVTIPGGIIVWVVGDQTKDGSESGTSFKQALYFKAKGLRLHDTMIYQTDKQPLNDNRYEPKFEYMFVFSKGRPSIWNPITEPSTYGGSKCSPTEYNQDGTKKEWHGNGIIKTEKVLGNVWYIPSGRGKSNKEDVKHPAVFPDELARRHILTWSNKNDLVFDPMCGSGTVQKMALMTGRKTIGIDISTEYLDIAKQRIELTRLPLFEQPDVEVTAEQLGLTI
jgi:site-specific DNA-methyltransferase (adenine-specific)